MRKLESLTISKVKMEVDFVTERDPTQHESVLYIFFKALKSCRQAVPSGEKADIFVILIFN